MGILDWIGERLDTPLKGVGIDPTGLSDSEKWAYRGRVVEALGRSIGTNPQSFSGAIDDMATKRLEAEQRELERQQKLQALQEQQAISALLTGQPPAGGASGAPAAGGPAAAFAAGSGGASPAATRANAYRQAAAMVAARDPVKAKQYMELAEQLDPKVEYSTDPKTFISPSGQPVSVLFSKTGGMKVIDLQPLPDRTYQDTGSEILVLDKATGRTLERLPKTMSPAEAANLRVAQGNLAVNQGNLGLARERFNREGVETGVNDKGEVVTYNKFNPGAGGSAVPGVRPTSAAGGEKPTEGQLGAAGYLLRMKKASEILDGPVTDDQGQPKLDAQGRPIPLESRSPGYLAGAAGSIPFVGNSARNKVMGADTQLYRQAQEDWVRAKLRKESGAAIGSDEMEREILTYFPQPGEDERTKAQKARARKIAEQSMEIAAGSAASRIGAPGAAPAAPAAGTSPRLPPGQRPSLDNIFGGR